MASIRKRGAKWQVQVRRDGAAPISRTFSTKRDAEAWARSTETDIERGDVPKRRAKLPTLLDLLIRYREQVTPTKRSLKVERCRIDKLCRNPLVRTPVDKLLPASIAAYRDARLKDVSGETVRQDLVLIRQVIEVARREWGCSLPVNPVDGIRKPKPATARTRRLTPEDQERLGQALATTRNPLIAYAIAFAVATAMRRGEILRIEWDHVDWASSVLVIPTTKNGHPRTIPLTVDALHTLRGVQSLSASDRFAFPVAAEAFKTSWRRVIERSGITDLRFHDLRHEAVSRFFEAGLSLPEVSLISGHRDPRQLMRYTYLDAQRVGEKLRHSAGSAGIPVKPGNNNNPR
jgi:integrase